MGSYGPEKRWGMDEDPHGVWFEIDRDLSLRSRPTTSSSAGAEGLEPPTSPCKGDRDVQVSELISRILVTLDTQEYPRVSRPRGPRVVRER